MQTLIKWIKFNLRYLGNPPWDTGIPAPELIQFIEDNQPGSALDLGCGTGTNLLALLDAGWKADGIEFAILAVQKTRKKIRDYKNNGRIFAGNIVDVNFLAEKYDLVLDIGCFHSLSIDERILYRRNIKRLLKKNGTLLMYAFMKQLDNMIGIDPFEINKFKEFLTLISQKDGWDDGKRPSTWLEFKKGENKSDLILGDL